MALNENGKTRGETAIQDVHRMIQKFFIGKKGVIALFSIGIALFILNFIFALMFTYPVVIEDFLINQGWKAVRSQKLVNSQYVEEGEKFMAQSSVTIVGVGRDVEHSLAGLLPQVEALGSQFKYSEAIFVCGNSVDKTIPILTEWTKRSPSNRTFIIHNTYSNDTVGVFKHVPMPREGRIAIARNLVLEEWKKRAKTKFLIVLDMDMRGWNPEGVKDSFGRRDSWDVMCAHGILVHGLYRDTYAFRTAEINTNHHCCGTDHSLYNISLQETIDSRQKLKQSKRKTHKMMDLRARKTSQLNPQPVLSCFGGLAIYKTDLLHECKYAYRSAEPPYMLDCEHVFFHQCLREKQNARIFSNPNMKLWYGHTGLMEMDFKKIFFKYLYGKVFTPVPP